MLCRTVVVAALSAGALMAGSVFTDQTAFLAAVQGIPNTRTELETFDYGRITAPDLSVTTKQDWPGTQGLAGFGHIQGGAWLDCVGRDCYNTMYSSTAWHFAEPVYAFGATFEYQNVDYPGSIGITMNGTVLPLQDGFWGFVSDTPMSEVDVLENSGKTDFPAWFPLHDVIQSQTYEMDNLYLQVDPPVSPAPEPASVLLLLIGGLALVIPRVINKS